MNATEQTAIATAMARAAETGQPWYACQGTRGYWHASNQRPINPVGVVIAVSPTGEIYGA